jgi:diacylglycerol kinase family enzyme
VAEADIGERREEPDTALSSDGSRHFIALVNARAGEVLQRGEEAFGAAIAEGFGALGVECDVRFVPPRKLAIAMESALAEKPHALLVAGGDGTVNHLLEHLTEADAPIGLLPLGTLNLLARDIGLTGPLADMLPALARMQVRRVDLGEVNGHYFHSNAGLGFFGRMARAREDARRTVPFSKMLGFSLAAIRSLLAHRPITIDLMVEGHHETYLADALLVTNNHFEGADWRRPRLDTGLLEVHMLKATGPWGRVRAALAVYRGNWRELPHLQSRAATSITVWRRGRKRSTIALDGEVYRVRNPIRFNSRPGALGLISGEALAPATAPEGP